MNQIPPSTAVVHIGVDIAKASFQADFMGKSANFPNTAKGHRDFAAKLPTGAFVVMEATGSYHLPLLRHLQSLHIPAAVANPARVRSLARALGIHAKTDPVDASLLSRFGQAIAPQPAPCKESVRSVLKELCTIRDALVTESVNWRNLIEHHQTAEGRRFAKARLAQARRDVARVEKRIAMLLGGATELSAEARILMGCKGVGPVTATVLLSWMPELGHINRRQAASLAGLAPYANDSGAQQGKRMIRGGRPRVRSALYLAAVSAIRHHPGLKASYQEMRAKGKPAKVALIAIARRLLLILNAKLKDHHDGHGNGAAIAPNAGEGAMPAAENGSHNPSEVPLHGDPSP